MSTVLTPGSRPSSGPSQLSPGSRASTHLRAGVCVRKDAQPSPNPRPPPLSPAAADAAAKTRRSGMRTAKRGALAVALGMLGTQGRFRRRGGRCFTSRAPEPAAEV